MPSVRGSWEPWASLVTLVALAMPTGSAAAPTSARSCTASALESSSAGWLSFDPEARVERTQDAGVTFRYRVRSGAVSLLARGNLDLSGCASLSFRVRSSHTGGLAFGVSEADESRYGSVTRVEAGRATDVRLNVDELQLAEDSTDEDGRLAPGPGLALWLVDVAVFGQTLDAEVRGERTLWLEAVAFSAERVPDAGRQTAGEVATLVLDSFETGLLRWMPVAASFEPPRFWLYPEDVALALVPGGPEPSPGHVLEARCPQQPMGALVLSRNVAGLDLSRAERFGFSARTERTATFLVSLEERAGARYEQRFELAPDRWQRVELSLDRFRLAGDSRDANGRLDLVALKLVSIVAARLEPGPVMTNRLSFDDPAFVLRPPSSASPRPPSPR